MRRIFRRSIFNSLSRNTYIILLSLLVLAGLSYASTGIVTGKWNNGQRNLNAFQDGDIFELGHLQDIEQNIDAVYNIFNLNFLREEGAYPSDPGTVKLYPGYGFRADEIRTDILSYNGKDYDYNSLVDTRETEVAIDKNGGGSLQLDTLVGGTVYAVIVKGFAPKYGNGDTDFHFINIYDCTGDKRLSTYYPLTTYLDWPDGGYFPASFFKITAPGDGCIMATTTDPTNVDIHYIIAIPGK